MSDPYEHKGMVAYTDQMNNWFRESFTNQMAQYYADRNLWFEKSFDNCMQPHVKAVNKLAKCLGRDIEEIAGCLSTGEKDADGALIIRSLDVAINELGVEMRKEVATQLKALRAGEHPSTITKSLDVTLSIADEILAA